MEEFYKPVLFICGVLLIVLGFVGQTEFYKKWSIKIAKKFAPYEVKENNLLRLIKIYSWYCLIFGIFVLFMSFIVDKL